MLTLLIILALAALVVFIIFADMQLVALDYQMEGVHSGNVSSVVILLLAIALLSVSECASMGEGSDELPDDEVPQDTYVVVHEDALTS